MFSTKDCLFTQKYSTFFMGATLCVSVTRLFIHFAQSYEAFPLLSSPLFPDSFLTFGQLFVFLISTASSPLAV